MGKQRPIHMKRRHGPGTAGQNGERDARIWERYEQLRSCKKVGVEEELSGERIRQIVNHRKRLLVKSERLKPLREAFAGKASRQVRRSNDQ